jgi:hypothetical protein
MNEINILYFSSEDLEIYFALKCLTLPTLFCSI